MSTIIKISQNFVYIRKFLDKNLYFKIRAFKILFERFEIKYKH